MVYNKVIIDKVVELVNKGVGYKEIIKELNLNVSSKALGKKIRSLGLLLTDVRSEFDRNRKCLNCNQNFEVKIKADPKKFCSRSCSVTYNNKLKPKITKLENNNLVKKNKTYRKIHLCKSCLINYEAKNRTSVYCNVCNFYKQNYELFDKLSINKNLSLKVKGLIALEILKKEYFDNKLSSLELFENYKVKENTLFQFFKKHKINLRNLNESHRNAYMSGRQKLPESNKTNYKQGWFITWENKNVYYRSSYELKYIHYLENIKISYDVEKLRIKYFDSQKKQLRTAIPDFYISSLNLIVEIKGRYRFDFQNMKDKYEKYKKLGYNFKLVYEHEEYNEEDFLNKLYQSDKFKVMKK